MTLLSSLLHWLEEPLPARAPESVVTMRSKERIRGAVARLLALRDPAELTSVDGDCLHYAQEVRELLAKEGDELRLLSVFGVEEPVVHFHLRTPEMDVIVDPTWLQFLRHEIPEGLPRMFVGTAEDLVDLVRPFAHLLPLRGVSGPRYTPEEFVEFFYGEGLQRDTRKDVTERYAGA